MVIGADAVHVICVVNPEQTVTFVGEVKTVIGPAFDQTFNLLATELIGKEQLLNILQR
jgi:hypothetical protein